MTRTLIASAIALFAALPALAMEDVACKDFMAMDPAGQMQAMADDGMMADTGGMAAGSMAGDSMMKGEDTETAAKACGMHPDMMVGEAMQAMH